MEPTVEKQEKVLLYSTPRNFLILILVVIGAFILGWLLGYLPSQATVRQLQSQTAQLEQQLSVSQERLRVAELRDLAGLMSYEANRHNYGTAATLATRFFNEVNEEIKRTTDEKLRQHLQSVLEQRDEITAALAQADPAVRERLAQIYAGFFQAAASK